MTIDTKRLATDAAYWDECGAPEDATAAIENGWVKYDYDGVGESWFWWPFDPEIKQGWRKTLTQCDTYHVPFIPRPQNPEVEWDGEGHPPAGCECGLTLGSGMFPHVKITYMGDGVFCYVDINNGNEYTGSLRDAIFTPRRTNEQRDREDLQRLLEEHLDWSHSKDMSNKAVDAIISSGWKKDA